MDREGGTSRSERRKRGSRRSTISGAAPSLPNEIKTRVRASSEAMRFPWSSSPTAPQDPASPEDLNTTPATARGSGQKRTSPATVLKSFFSSKSAEDDEGLAGAQKHVFSRKSIEDDGPPTSPTSPEADRRESALSAAMRQVKTRKRKGSLRKTALLGGRRISLLQRPSSMKQVDEAILPDPDHDFDDDAFEDDVKAPSEQSTSVRKRSPTAIPLSARRNFTYPASDAGAIETPAVTMARLSLVTDAQTTSGPSRTIANELGSPTETKSIQGTATNYTSTTSDDDILTFSRPAKSTSTASQTNLTPLSTSPGSYFPPQPPLSLSRHTTSSTSHGHTRLSSPLSRTQPISAYPDTKSTPVKALTSSSYPSSETEYWGYFILLCTWLTFTVGMGSCLEIWSWAWEVEDGRVKPHVPPELSELNDDETLPIVGYYPALIVLTIGVTSWVWVTVAWVGMKYFRHAKVEV